MPYVPGFDYDLFLSYASGDNQQGAVEEFAGAIEKHISDNLVNCFSPQEKIRIYFDRQRLASQTAVNWEEHPRAAASSCAPFRATAVARPGPKAPVDGGDHTRPGAPPQQLLLLSV